MQFKKIALKSFIYSGFSSIIVRVLTFGTTIVLSRILTPGDFGVMGQAILFINILTIFADLGFSSALVYQKEDLKKVINTTFLVIIPVGFSLSLIGFFASPLIAAFFKTPELANIYRVLTWTVFLTAVSSVLNGILTKKMKFDKLIYPEILSALAYAAVGITLALKGFGLWSLVLAYIAQPVCNVILLYVFCPWKLEFTFDKALAKHMFLYGKEIIFTSFIVYFAFQGDNLFCGKFLGAASLGYYAMAYGLTSLPVIAISQMVITKVAFPLFSKIQDNAEELRDTFLKMFLINCFLTLPLSLGMLTLGKELVVALFSMKWLPMLFALRVLCLFGFMRSMNGLCGTLLNSVGKPHITRNAVLLHVAVMAALIFPLGFKWGITGVGIAVLIAQAASVIFVMVISQQILAFKWGRIGEILLFCGIGSVIACACLYFIARHVIIKANITSVIIWLVLGTIIYCGTILLLRKKWYTEAVELLRNRE